MEIVNSQGLRLRLSHCLHPQAIIGNKNYHRSFRLLSSKMVNKKIRQKYCWPTVRTLAMETIHTMVDLKITIWARLTRNMDSMTHMVTHTITVRMHLTQPKPSQKLPLMDLNGSVQARRTNDISSPPRQQHQQPQQQLRQQKYTRAPTAGNVTQWPLTPFF